MQIKPFNAVRPMPGLEARIASPPYDVVDRKQARKIAGDNPMSFLHVTRADMDLPDETDPYDPNVYAASADAYRRFREQGWLRTDDEPGLYAYRLAGAGHAQTGLVAVVHVDDYEAGRIKRHEFTREVPEEDRTRHISALQAQAGPVLLAYRDNERVTRCLEEAAATSPLFDLEAKDGIRHTGWRVPDPGGLVEAFAAVPAAYIADGHHRIAGAARVARERRADRGKTAERECDWILAVLFPASHLRILAYNREVLELNGLTPKALVERLAAHFTMRMLDGADEPEAGSLDLYLAGCWRRLTPLAPPDAADPVARLDVQLLQDIVLGPILGIQDPRRDERLRCTGGRSPAELAMDVDGGLAAAAFSLAPVRIEQIMAVSDANLTMPPKSTWFEPKLRSGLFVHDIAPAYA